VHQAFFIEEAIGEITSAIIKNVEVLGLILTGGATSLIVCQKLGVDSVSIVKEIEPGIPLLILSNGIPAVTKAGGFGVEDSLVQVTQKLRRLISN
jgi:4-hydroxythreonine-4-phosphate dehydrogenase